MSLCVRLSEMQELELFSVLTEGRAGPPVSAISLERYQNSDLQVFSSQLGNKNREFKDSALLSDFFLVKRMKKFYFLCFNYKHDLIYSGYFPNVSNVSNAT